MVLLGIKTDAYCDCGHSSLEDNIVVHTSDCLHQGAESDSFIDSMGRGTHVASEEQCNKRRKVALLLSLAMPK